jgi:hypothetical protein
VRRPDGTKPFLKSGGAVTDASEGMDPIGGRIGLAFIASSIMSVLEGGWGRPLGRA